MPDHPFEKTKLHPFRNRDASVTPATDHAPIMAGDGQATTNQATYAELAVTTNYTFLTGASHPDEFVQRAADLGHAAAAIADVNSVAGIVRAHVAAKDAGIPLAVGARLVFEDPTAPHILVFPTTRPAYARLCGLLTRGKRRAGKGQCLLTIDDLIEFQQDLLACIVAPGVIPALSDAFIATAARLRAVFDRDRLSIAAWRPYGPHDDALLAAVARVCERTAIPMAAANEAHYHDPARRELHDVLACIRHGCTIQEAGQRLNPNAERCLKPGHIMARMFARYPAALARSADIARRACAFSLDELRYEYPAEPCPPGVCAKDHLAALTRAGARTRYPGGIPEKVSAQIDYELALIGELHYEPYFLTCHDIVTFARGRGILCQGRGGAANSAVCYCLGITEVDPARFNLLFERFISRARNEPPDIDIDFEHERREEVIQHLYQTYGRDRAALTAEVISYRGRSAVRDVGKAMGLSPDRVDALAKELDMWGGLPKRERTPSVSEGRRTGSVSDRRSSPGERAKAASTNPDNALIAKVLSLSAELSGFPRHLSQHVGGFVITRTKLHELVPIENAAMEDRTVIEWDKDDIDALGILKVDVLGLGMLTCIRKAFTLVRESTGRDLSIAKVFAAEPHDDPDVFDMICKADTVGVFQIESRAQMSMLPRLRPREFYDLVIEVAIVRPGPIQGKMVHPYLRRRSGEESVTYPSPQVQEVLKRTLGVPLFQEQAMQLAIVAAGFTPDEADKLRRAMAAWKRKGDLIFRFGQRLIDGMIARGYPPEFAHRCFEQIKGFSEYGFPESHAASFAILVYVSCWLKHYYPAAFAAALINSQPMGFYQPAQIIRDAQEHAVEVRPVDVMHSTWDCTLEGLSRVARRSPSVLNAAPGSTPHQSATPALRLGMRLVKGLAQQDADAISDAVTRRHATGGAFTTIEQLRRESGASVGALRCLARADAFASMGITRQAALWAVRSMRDVPMPLFDHVLSAPLRTPSVSAGRGTGSVSDPLPTPTPDSMTDGDRRATQSTQPDIESLGRESLPVLAPPVHVMHDYAFTGLSLKAHPLSFIRRALDLRGTVPASDLRSEALCPSGKKVSIAGIVLVRQRPGTASGVVFITLEDETGIANLIIWPKVFERWRTIARASATLLCHGRVERSGDVVHIHAQSFESLDDQLSGIGAMSRDFH